ncbi:MAG: class I poly(R)-hydroxyalkanoic acid synthase [Hydrogenophaga sp.]|nr:class I poly(R)-hydroxyalkanoic acid synthase [Hydrogenophaga sp.]
MDPLLPNPDPTRWLDELMRTSTAPWPLADATVQAWQQGLAQVNAFWAAALAPTDAAAADRRFGAEAWQQDPRFASLSQTYLRFAALMQQSVDKAPLDARSKGQCAFMLRQLVDAMSPANCLATNPEAMQVVLDSGGTSLLEGARLFLADVAKGRISMSDDQAFEVGRNLATTPGSVVFENELMQLIQYAPTTTKVHQRPLLIVPPCINKYYILDLQPDNSLVAYAVAQGHSVFLVSWRNVTAAQGHLGWDDYVEQGVLQAVSVTQRIGRSQQINTLGFCIGGTLLASALAVAAARGESPAASLTLLTTLLDFSDTGELGLMVDPQMVAAREASIGQGGLLRGRELAQVFAALRANDLIWPYVVNSYLKGQAPPAFDLLHWNGDDTNLPGPMYCWYLRQTYLENRLREPGGTQQCGVPVDLSRIDAPAFVYASREDHIVPWHSAYASTGLLRGDSRFVLGASGHIAGVINPPAKRKRHHWTGPLAADAPAWLDAAQRVEGSWWPAWSEWLLGHAGTLVAAPRKPGHAAFPVIEPAPGRYVQTPAA